MNDFNQNSNLSEIRVERSASGEVVRVDVGGGGISNFKEKPSDRPPLQPLENHLQTTIPACDDVASGAKPLPLHQELLHTKNHSGIDASTRRKHII